MNHPFDEPMPRGVSVSVRDVLGTGMMNARLAATRIRHVYEDTGLVALNPTTFQQDMAVRARELEKAESDLVQALADLRSARLAIERLWR